MQRYGLTDPQGFDCNRLNAGLKLELNFGKNGSIEIDARDLLANGSPGSGFK
jgi:hypothetical protein